MTKHSKPLVSIITSWFEHHGYGKEFKLPPGIELAYNAGIETFELYFLSEADIPWYAQAAGKGSPEDVRDPAPRKSVRRFAADLKPDEVQQISRELSAGFHSLKNNGRSIVGRSPKFVALATFFPGISSKKPEMRKESVNAVKNAILLASHLGAAVVEIVGGAGVPTSDDGDVYSVAEFEKKKIGFIAESLAKVYEAAKEEIGTKPGMKMPLLCLELEPGSSFLVNSLDRFCEVRDALKDRSPEAAEYLAMNLDLAHLFIAEGCDNTLVNAIKERKIEIGHFHISDHSADRDRGGIHSSDLLLGKFHTKEEYMPWLKYACELRHGSASPGHRFLGGVSIELEACNQIERVHSAYETCISWCREAEQAVLKEEELRGGFDQEGVLLCIDIGRSTEVINGDPNDLQDILSELALAIGSGGGRLTSFLGDGFMAIFAVDGYYGSMNALANRVLEALGEMCQSFQHYCDASEKYRDAGLTVRAAVHYGTVHQPIEGGFKNLHIGYDLIVLHRFCDYLKGAENYELDVLATLGFSQSFMDMWAGTPWQSSMVPEPKSLGEKQLKGLKEDLKVHMSMIFRNGAAG